MQTSARTAEKRRRRTMTLVEALIMGAAIKPRPVFVKMRAVIPGRERSERTRNLEIPGSLRAPE
jgi:hypothetical protein